MLFSTAPKGMIKMRKRLFALALALLIFALQAASVFANSQVSGSDLSQSDAPTIDESMNMDMTAEEFAADVALGWNLGDTLDSWARDAGYDDYHNATAYQLLLRYDDAKGNRSASMNVPFDENNKCTIEWATGLIESDDSIKIGDIGFEIWNLTVEEAVEVKVKVTTARLTLRSGIAYDVKELLGEHTITISRYGTGAFVCYNSFPDFVKRTYGILDGKFKMTVELIDYPQADYTKPQFFETLNNNPLTTERMIAAVKAAGFNAVRVPVTFFNHTLSATDVIDEGWLDRVEEIARYCIDQDMYCIICMYHDGASTGWLRVNTSDSDVVTKKYAYLWEQIASRFTDYGERLILQGFNELTNAENDWDYPGDADAQWVNKLNQIFVDTVRSTGGNNLDRVLLLGTYAGAADEKMINAFDTPQDIADDRLAVFVNAYTPYQFSKNISTATDDEDEKEVSETDTSSYAWGSAEDKAELDALFKSLYNRFIKNGIPVVITEFGSVDKANTDARIAHATYYIQTAAKYGIPCFWWDDGDFFKRKELSWSHTELLDAMINSAATRLADLKIAPIADQYHTGSPVCPIPQISDPSVMVASDSSLSLIYGKDYSVKYENNVEIGEATVIISGLTGKYVGTTTVTFNIVERPVAGIISNLAEENPDIPIVIMLSVPIFLCLGGISVMKYLKRKEESRIAAVYAETRLEAEEKAAENNRLLFGNNRFSQYDIETTNDYDEAERYYSEQKRSRSGEAFGNDVGNGFDDDF